MHACLLPVTELLIYIYIYLYLYIYSNRNAQVISALEDIAFTANDLPTFSNIFRYCQLICHDILFIYRVAYLLILSMHNWMLQSVKEKLVETIASESRKVVQVIYFSPIGKHQY